MRVVPANDCVTVPPLPVIASMPRLRRWSASITTAHEMIASTRREMQRHFDDRSEARQESECRDVHQERSTAVEEAPDALSELTA
jgi:hypothetical protein